MITADIHVHTDYFHALNTVEEMYEKAIEMGLKYFGFSEHSPLPEGFSCLLYREGDLYQAFDDYVHDVLKLKERKNLDLENKNLPNVLLGVELDFTPSHSFWMDHIIQKYPFDYIIGTIHFVGEQNIGLWNFESTTLEEKFEFYKKYYEFTAELAKWGKADIVAHPDFVKIPSIENFNKWLETKEAMISIENALCEIKKANMVLEISTGGLKKRCKQIHPAPKIMELVAKLDIPISFASDTHSVNTVAYEFDELAKFASSFGYKKHVIFENREPICLDF